MKNHGGKREGAGRPPGRTTQYSKIERVLESVGVDPIEILARIAHGDSEWLDHTDKRGEAEPISLSMRASVASELIKYYVPKLKQIDLTTPTESPLAQILRDIAESESASGLPEPIE